MRYQKSSKVLTAILLASGGTLESAHAGWLDKMQTLWSQAVDKTQSLYAESWASLPGKVRLCVATELKGWIDESVLPTFKQKAPLIAINIEAHGSGALVDAMNNGNTMKCDMLITGSDISAMRWNAFDISKRTPVAYSPTVWVGDKEKLDAGRAFLGKTADARLSCNDLAQVAAANRYSKIKKDGKGKLELEMTTSNSGQSMYVSCVYSIADALDPKEVEDKFNSNPALEDQVKAFFTQVAFQQDSTTTLTLDPKGFMHPNGIGYKHLAIATYESFLPQLDQEFAKQGKTMEVIYPAVSILNNFPATIITSDGKAAKALLDYMLSEEAQRGLLKYGLRPANPKVSYSSDRVGRYFNNDIEVGDAPADHQALRDMWDTVADMEKVKGIRF